MPKNYTYTLNDRVLEKLCNIGAQGNKEITENGTDIDVKKYATVSVAVSGGAALDADSYYYQGDISEEPEKLTAIDGDGLYEITDDTTINKVEVEYGNYYMWTGQALDNITNKLPSSAGLYSYTSDGCGPKFEQQNVSYWTAVYWDGDQFNDLYVPYNKLILVTHSQASGCDSWYNEIELPSNVGDEVEITVDYQNYKIVRLED